MQRGRDTSGIFRLLFKVDTTVRFLLFPFSQSGEGGGQWTALCLKASETKRQVRCGAESGYKVAIIISRTSYRIDKTCFVRF